MRWSQKRSVFEYLYALLLMAPLRCRQCDRRFIGFVWARPKELALRRRHVFGMVAVLVILMILLFALGYRLGKGGALGISTGAASLDDG